MIGVPSTGYRQYIHICIHRPGTVLTNDSNVANISTPHLPSSLQPLLPCKAPSKTTQSSKDQKLKAHTQDKMPTWMDMVRGGCGAK